MMRLHGETTVQFSLMRTSSRDLSLRRNADAAFGRAEAMGVFGARVAAVLVFVAVSVCGSAMAAPKAIFIKREPVDILPSQFDFSKDELKRLEAEAIAGNRSAAYKVLQYYSFYHPKDEKRQLRWATVGADNGDPQSMELLAVILRRLGGRDNCRAAIGWLERAMSQSDDHAFLDDAGALRDEILRNRACEW